MQPLYTTLLTTEELTTAAARLIPIMTPLFTGQSLLLSIATAAETNREAIVRAASRKAASDFTDPLADSDSARDAAFTALRDFAGVWAKNPTATANQRSAGVRLQGVFTRHGNGIIHLGYNRQTGKMNELISELKNTECAADLAAITLTPLFAALVTAQEEFEDIVRDKSAVESGEVIPSIGEHRPQLERYLNLLLGNIAVWHEIMPTPALGSTIAQIEEIITTIKAPVLARRTRSQSEPQVVAPTA